MNIKSLFPIYKKMPDLVYWDSAATALKPQVVLDKMMEYYTKYSANIHRGIYPISEMATEEYEKAREKVAKYIGAKNEEIIFTSGTTESVNMVARGWGDANVSQGDEIVVSELEHHSNLVPWQELCQRVKAKLVVWKLDNNLNLNSNDLKKIVNDKTKLVAVTQVSNVLGVENEIEKIVTEVKKINPKTLVLVDGAQAMAHMRVDVSKMGADFYVFSGHKIYGPTGVGVLWIRRMVVDKVRPVRFGGGMIKTVGWEGTDFAAGVERYEGGTPPVAEVIGLGAAIDFLEEYGFGRGLDLVTNLERLDGVEVVGPKGVRAGVVAMTMEGVHPHDVADILGRRGVCVRAGHHCAQPLHQRLGVEATFRASVGIYNDETDVEKLVTGLKEVRRIFHG